MKLLIPIITAMLLFFFSCTSEKKVTVKSKNEIAVIAYYSGNERQIANYDVTKLTHIIFSFCHLKGNKLNVDDAGDSATIKKLVSLKAVNPSLKVMLSLGGWGGCKLCSPVFSSEAGRKEFAESTKQLNDYFKTDGLDLDWEYPAIEGYPGHAFLAEDKTNFTLLVKELRNTLGKKAVLSFAAGGFTRFFTNSIDWDKVIPELDMVNIMSYDLVGGYSKTTGHHTPLFSSAAQKESADHAVRFLDSLGVPKNKMVIGAAFYARVWENVEPANNGMYQPGKFKSSIAYKRFSNSINADSGFVFFYDSTAKASFAYNSSKKLFATFDDSSSVINKTKYVKENGLKGIMFWELTSDKESNGLLHAIFEEKKKRN